MLQLLRPTRPTARALRQEKSLQCKAHAPQLESSQQLLQLQKSPRRTKDPAHLKINESIKLFFKKRSGRLSEKIVNSNECVHAKSLQSCLFATLWTVAHQAPLSVGFSGQEYWSGLPCPPPPSQARDQKCVSYISPALAGGFFTTSTTWEVQRAT